MKVSAWTKIKFLQLFIHVLAFIGCIFYWDIYWFICAIVSWFFIYLIGATIGYHRLYAHKSFTSNKFIKYITLFMGTIMGVGSVIGWVGQHRQHHAYSDVSKNLDPYWAHDDYSFLGTIKSWAICPRPINFKIKMVRDLIQDPEILFFHTWYFSIIFLWMTFLFCINIKALIFLFALPSVGCYISGQLSGVFGHRIGKQIYKETNDHSKDCHWVNIFSLGEGYQNTHHRYPNKIVMGKYDLSGYIIERFLAK